MTAPSEPLQIRGLVKSYGGVRAVRGIELAVRAGEVFGFVGPNGAGKSTTIRCILDLLRPTAGEIRVFGRDPRTDGALIRERVAYVPGELRLPERLTGRHFLRSIGRLRARFEAGRIDELAERFTLDLDRPIRQLSSGNRRKVSVLSAFLSDADLLILDEPTSSSGSAARRARPCSCPRTSCPRCRASPTGWPCSAPAASWPPAP